MATRTTRARKWRLPKKKTTKRAAKKTSGARAMWKGRLILGSIEVPVKLYSAVTDKSIHFRLLDPKKHEPVKQQMIDPDTGDVVPHAEIRSAWQSKAGLLVMLDDEELVSAEPKESRDVEITRFIDATDVESEWYDRPYYLGPDDSESKNYFALAQALANQGKEGIEAGDKAADTIDLMAALERSLTKRKAARKAARKADAKRGRKKAAA